MLRRVSTTHAVRSLAFSSDGTRLAAGMQDGSFTVYDSGLVFVCTVEFLQPNTLKCVDTSGHLSTISLLYRLNSKDAGMLCIE